MRMICVSELIGNTFGALFDPKKKIIKKKIVRLDIFCITARVLSKFFLVQTNMHPVPVPCKKAK